MRMQSCEKYQNLPVNQKLLSCLSAYSTFVTLQFLGLVVSSLNDILLKKQSLAVFFASSQLYLEEMFQYNRIG